MLIFRIVEKMQNLFDRINEKFQTIRIAYGKQQNCTKYSTKTSVGILRNRTLLKCKVLSIMQYQLFLISDPPFYYETGMTEKKRVKTLGSQRAQISHAG